MLKILRTKFFQNQGGRLYSLILTCMFASASQICAQDQVKIDSLLNILENSDLETKQEASINQLLAKEFYFSDRDTSHYFAGKGYQLAKKSGDNFLIANGLVQTSLIHLAAVELEIAMDKLEEAEELISNLGNTTATEDDIIGTKISIQRNKADLYNKSNKYEEAINCELLVNELAIATNNKYEEAMSYYNIGIVHFTNQNYERAAYYQKKALKIGTEIPNYFVIASSSNLGGLVYFYTNQQDSAKLMSTKAYNIAKEHNLVQPSIEAANTLASIHFQNEEYESALIYAQNILEIATEINEQYYIVGTYGSLADIHSRLNDPDNARKYFVKFEEANKELNNLQLARYHYKNYSEFEKSVGNYDKAYDLLTKYFEIQDSIYNKENKEIQVELEMKYEVAKKNGELNKQKVTITQQKNQRNILVGGGLFTLLLAGFFWNRKNISQKIYNQQKEIDNQKIAQLEKEKKLLTMSSMIEGQEAERKRIAQDLHDGLGGLLASVKTKFGIIQDQIKALESLDIYNEANTMLDNACNEVRKIAHNMMPDALTKLGLVAAVRDVAAQFGEMKVDVIDLGIHELDDTQKVMLYRVIQEFLNNTRKHAVATEVIIQFSIEGDNQLVYLEDNGGGFDKYSVETENGMGLQSMESRINYIDGLLEIDSEVGVGTTMTIKVPKEVLHESLVNV